MTTATERLASLGYAHREPTPGERMAWREDNRRPFPLHARVIVDRAGDVVAVLRRGEVTAWCDEREAACRI